MRYGLWVKDGAWNFWVGMTSNNVFVPLSFDADEAEVRALSYRQSRPEATVEVRESPPLELPWSEAEWKRATGSC